MGAYRRMLSSPLPLALLVAVVAALALAAPVAAQAPPDTPSSVSVTRADGTLTATWPAPDGATSYHVTYSSDGGASWSLASMGLRATSITFSVSNSKTYIVGVRARNANGWGGWRNSSPAGPWTDPALSPPATPSSVSTTRANGTLTASWPAVVSATSYHVTYSADGGATWMLAAFSHTGTSITISDVVNTSAYIAGVRARNANGWSGWRNSPPASAYKPPSGTSPPAAPDSVTLTRSDGSITASWPAVSGADGYHIGFSTDLGYNWGRLTTHHASTTFTFDADNNVTYMVCVMSYNDDGGSEWRDSAPAGPYTPPPPGQPTGLTATANDDGSATITWTDPGDASITGYQYQTREDDGAWERTRPSRGAAQTPPPMRYKDLSAGRRTTSTCKRSTRAARV